jgi:type VI secretion system protein ImpC
MTANASQPTTQVRWVVLGPLSPTPTGKTFTFNRANYLEWVEGRGVSCAATLPASLGAKCAGVAAPIPVPKLSALTAKGAIEAVPVLSKLLALAGDVREEAETLAQVEALVGPGDLVTRLKALLAGEASAPAPGAVAVAPGKALDAADMPKQQAAASSAVDAFLRTARSGASTVKRSKGARKLRDAIEEAVYAAARELLASAPVRGLEVPLRGLKLLTDSCPQKASMTVEVLDMSVTDGMDALRDRPRGDLVDEADAVLVPHSISDTALLGRLAELGEELLCPVVVDVHPSVLGKKSVAAMVDELDEAKPQEDEPAWLALRQEESSRWLCAVANGVVLFDEGTTVARRIVLGSGVWALGAMLAKSYAETGGFARIMGQPGSLQAPGVQILSGGRYDGTSAPTEIFTPIRGQTSMAKHGVLLLGSSRNSNSVVLAATPMARAAGDAVPLAAQILTGRVVRFAQWVRDQLPPGANSDTARSVFQEAAKVFLFPGLSQFGQVDAVIREKDGKRELMVTALVHPQLAGIPFEFGFPLSLE